MTWTVVPGAANGQGPRSVNPQALVKDAVAPVKQQKPKLGRVLTVDDEPSICKAMSMLLSEEGYDAIAAQSGESALAIIRNEHVDVMVIDLRIPDMRGDVIFEVAAGYQPHLRYQTLFFTGDITDRALKLIGACKCQYLYKPFLNSDMLSAVAALAPRVQSAAG